MPQHRCLKIFVKWIVRRCAVCSEAVFEELLFCHCQTFSTLFLFFHGYLYGFGQVDVVIFIAKVPTYTIVTAIYGDAPHLRSTKSCLSADWMVSPHSLYWFEIQKLLSVSIFFRGHHISSIIIDTCTIIEQIINFV